MVFKSPYADVEPEARFKGLVSNFFWHQLDVFATNTLLVDHASGREWTGAQLKQMATSLAQNFIDKLKLEPDFDCVAFYPNSDHIQLAAMGVLFAGGSFCAGGPEDPEQEHAHMLEMMRPALVLAELRLVDEMLALRAKLQLNYQLVVMDDQQLEGAAFDQLAARSAAPVFGLQRHLMAVAQPATSLANPALPVQVDPERPAFVLFTSGSTGRPKPVGRSQRNSLYVCHCLPEAVADQLWPLNERSVVAGHLQLDHGTGTFNLKQCLAKGFKLILMHGYDYARLLDACERYRITDVCLGSALLHNLISFTLGQVESAEAAQRHSLSSVRHFMAVGSPIASQELADEFVSRFKGCSIRQAYGMTECGLMTIVEHRPQGKLAHDEVGLLLPNFRLKLLALQDEGKLRVGDEITDCNVEGELYVSGPTVSTGYLGAEFAEQSLASFGRDGFYKSNDICLVLEGGRLRVRGRYSEVLCLHDGWKVLPSEIERVLLAHPLVKEACVLGVPHPVLPTCHAPRAYVVPRDGVEADFEHQLEARLEAAAAGRAGTATESGQLASNGPSEYCGGARADEGRQPNGHSAATKRRLSKSALFQFSAERMSEPKHLVGGIRFLRRLPKISLGKIDKKLLRKLDA